MAHKPVIGLIGGIGSGKSRVAAALAHHGAAIVAGDQLGHEALRQPEIRQRVVGRFGNSILDSTGQIDRRILGQKVFAHTGELHALEQLVFPWIERRIREEIELAREKPDVSCIVLDAAVMLEAGWNSFCDWIVYVHAPRAARLQRLAEQRGWTPKEVQARSEAQFSLTEKVTRADTAIDNAGPPEALAAQLASLLSRIFPVATSGGFLDNS